jgi:hypothetical protein
MGSDRGVRPPLDVRLPDPATDRAMRDHRRAWTDLLALVAIGARVIHGIELADGVDTPVAHELGRAPLYVRESCPRGATSTGRVVEVSSADFNRAEHVVLRATGWGATITVDVLVA